MPSAVQKIKLLVVDTSPSMANVLTTFAEKNNYDADVYSDSAEACVSLANRFGNMGLGGGYDCVVLGWPNGRASMITDLLAALATPDHSDLPLIVLSEEPDKDVQTLARRRARTRTLLWRDHQRIRDILESFVVQQMPVVATEQQTLANAVPVRLTSENVTSTGAASPLSAKRVLLVDDTPSVCHTLRDMLESNRYHVTLAGNAAEARATLSNNQFDLVLTEFFLREESGESLCRYLKSLDQRAPVYAVMTRKNLDSVVQRSLAVGAITCLDKSESTEILFARIDAIVRGLASSVNAENAMESAKVTQNPAVDKIAGLMRLTAAPSILLDDSRSIVAANFAAARLLSAGKPEALGKVRFEKSVHGAPIKRSMDEPVKALFRNLDGESLSVVYRARDIDGVEYGFSGELCILTFELVGESDKRTAATESPNEVVSVAETVAVVKPQIAALAAAVEAPSPEIVEPVLPEIVDRASIEQSISRALDSDEGKSVFSLLMLDIKMVAAVTGDRLGLGKSEPMLEMVKSELRRCYSRKDSLAYVDDGKFVFLIESGNSNQARRLAERLVRRLPKLIAHLSDVRLLSHAAFIELPASSDVSSRIILKHCAAACLKIEVDGMDNRIFSIDASVKLSPRRASGVSVAKPVTTESRRVKKVTEVRRKVVRQEDHMAETV